jgi:uncharacterized protein (TIGR02118 family)
MYKLVIVFFKPTAWVMFEQGWQKFLGLAEQMPGLCKEVVSDPDQLVFGSPNQKIQKIHELYFNSREELEAALNAEAGQKAGQWLHSFTQGQFLLMIARHMEAIPEQFKKPPKEYSPSS